MFGFTICFASSLGGKKVWLWYWLVNPFVHAQLYSRRIIQWLVRMECPANGCKWSRESSPLVNCAKIGLSYFVRAINGPAPHGVCMINFSFLSKASWSSLGRQRANQSHTRRRHEANLTSWLVGAGRGDQPLSFYRRPRTARKSYWAPL